MLSVNQWMFVVKEVQLKKKSIGDVHKTSSFNRVEKNESLPVVVKVSRNNMIHCSLYCVSILNTNLMCMENGLIDTVFSASRFRI